MDVEYKSFRTRDSRAQFIGERFGGLLHGKILDVGCDEGSLKKYLPKDAAYTGVDVAGKPDLVINLEEAPALPFQDKAFDSVVCTDVLEHLDALHRVFDELVRVTGKHLIVSLPNCWVNARQPIARGRGDFSHYGLPLDKPMDRHKWFFSLTEIEAFFRGQAERKGLTIRDMFATEKARSLPLRLARLRHPRQHHYLNRYANTLWVVFER